MIAWIVFGFLASAQAAETGVLGFDAAVARILDRSTAIATQRAVSNSVTAGNLPIRLAVAPTLSFSGSASTTGGDAIGTPYGSGQLGGSAALNLFKWGADWKNWRAADYDEASQEGLLEDAVVRAQDAAVDTLVAHLEARKLVDVNKAIVKVHDESLAVARERFAGGYLPRQEMEKVEVDLANAQAALADARSASYAAEAALVNLLGDSRVELDWPWKARFAALSLAAEPDDAALAALLARRPDWRAAQAKVDAEGARLSRNWRLLGPSFDSQFTWGYLTSGTGLLGSETGATAGQQWQGTVSVSLPLFDHLTLYSSARTQAFTVSEAEQALEQVRRDARAQWDSARRTFTNALASAQVRDRTLETSRRLYADNLARFKIGRISADELALEQTRLYTSEQLAVSGWSAAHVAYSSLCRALGARLEACRP